MKTFNEYQKEAAKTIPAEFDGETMIDREALKGGEE